jgi:hypothetical protein
VGTRGRKKGIVDLTPCSIARVMSGIDLFFVLKRKERRVFRLLSHTGWSKSNKGVINLKLREGVKIFSQNIPLGYCLQRSL